ncbi:hypothetical protein DFH08DRAFT_821917 [Mycena albidolilacea]|uniref:Uncharacterized protein n=1 Tax=Mycena albidolilacea TaxID=1033008 RepID=A0AAD6Z972_9AGAR|nr:hypothetical protein DFH08DRAFT_821917 [Mycena albidolilacea]
MYSKHSDVLMFSIHGQAVTYSLSNQAPLHFDGYVEMMRFESICNGKAMYIDLISYLCTSDSAAVYDLLSSFHMSAFQEMAACLGATVLAGDCPLAVLLFNGHKYFVLVLCPRSRVDAHNATLFPAAHDPEKNPIYQLRLEHGTRLLNSNQPPEESELTFVQSVVLQADASLACLDEEMTELQEKLHQTHIRLFGYGTRNTLDYIKGQRVWP